MSGFRELVAWQKAMEVVEETYRLTENLPRKETYGLTDQMRRAAVSVASNIAEGSGRGGRKEFIQFLKIARGSIRELETQIEVCIRVKYIERNQAETLFERLDHTGRLISKLIQTLSPSNESN